MSTSKQNSISTVVALFTALVVTGCVTDQYGHTTIDSRALGALGGIAVGGLGCKLAGGKTGTCLAIATATGAAGALLAHYLNQQEQQSLAQTQTQMLNTSPKETVHGRWQNPDGTKSVVLTAGPERMVNVSTVPFKERYPGISRVPANAQCRDVNKMLGSGQSVKVLNCRTQEDDYVEVGQTT